jgi:hypothetical protein
VICYPTCQGFVTMKSKIRRNDGVAKTARFMFSISYTCAGAVSGSHRPLHAPIRFNESALRRRKCHHRNSLGEAVGYSPAYSFLHSSLDTFR